MPPITIQPGEILWLERSPATESLADLEPGCLDHPVLVLATGQKQKGLPADRSIAITIITSFGKKLLQNRFPSSNKHLKAQRKHYIPLHRPPYPRTPHPDNRRILALTTTGAPDAPGRDRVSYVTLRTPLYVARAHLAALHHGTARVTYDGLRLVVERVNARCRRARVRKVPLPREYVDRRKDAGVERSVLSPVPEEVGAVEEGPPPSYAEVAGRGWRRCAPERRPVPRMVMRVPVRGKEGGEAVGKTVGKTVGYGTVVREERDLECGRCAQEEEEEGAEAVGLWKVLAGAGLVAWAVGTGVWALGTGMVSVAWGTGVWMAQQDVESFGLVVFGVCLVVSVARGLVVDFLGKS